MELQLEGLLHPKGRVCESENTHRSCFFCCFMSCPILVGSAFCRFLAIIYIYTEHSNKCIYSYIYIYIVVSQFLLVVSPFSTAWGLHSIYFAKVNFLVVLSLLVSIGQALPTGVRWGSCKSWWNHVEICRNNSEEPVSLNFSHWD